MRQHVQTTISLQSMIITAEQREGGILPVSQFVEEESQKIELGQKTKLGWKGTRQFVHVETQKRDLG